MLKCEDLYLFQLIEQLTTLLTSFCLTVVLSFVGCLLWCECLEVAQNSIGQRKQTNTFIGHL